MKQACFQWIACVAASVCSSARVIADPSTDTAYVVQAKTFNQKIVCAL